MEPASPSVIARDCALVSVADPCVLHECAACARATRPALQLMQFVGVLTHDMPAVDALDEAIGAAHTETLLRVANAVLRALIKAASAIH